jgi:sarcosine oxidase subunit gamma
VTAELTVRQDIGSPLAGYVDRFADLANASGGAVRIAEQPLLAQLTLRTDPGATALGAPLPAIGHVAVVDGVRVLGLGPDEWLLIGPPGAQDHLQTELTGHAAVVDVSGQRTVLALNGPNCRDVLARGCALDLHPSVFSGDRCVQTTLARAQVILVGHREAPGSYWILARSSFARYVADWLLDAALEYRHQEK